MATPKKRPPSSRQYVRQPMPGFVEFHHPKLVPEPPAGAAWLHELKFDGYRLQIRVESGRVTIWTRNGHDWTAKFPEIAAEAARLPDCILDGELCALDAAGLPNFSKLRSSISPGKTAGLVVFVFDILWHGQDDLRTFKLIDRKAILSGLLEGAGASGLRFVAPLPSGGPAALMAACRMSLEGIVSKRRDSLYRGGRFETWLKAKCRPGQEVVLGGWVQEPQRAFKAVLAGVYEGQRLRYVGSVKSGFGKTPGLAARLLELETDKSPFELGGPPRKTGEIRWARPELVANVEFAEWTADAKLRQASFKGLRDDKDPREVVRETPDESVIL